MALPDIKHDVKKKEVPKKMRETSPKSKRLNKTRRH
jgi:hypothetical protein